MRSAKWLEAKASARAEWYFAFDGSVSMWTEAPIVRGLIATPAQDPSRATTPLHAAIISPGPQALTSYSLSASPTTVTEGNQVTFTITRSGDKPAETLYFSTLSDGTATYAEGDYTTTSGGQPANIAVSFSSGTTSRTVTLNIINDGVSDSGEQFRAIVQRNASDPVSTYIDRSSYVTINDAAPNTSYALTASPTTVIEGNQVTFTITRSGDKPAETVYFSTLSDGTATYAEGDYTTTSGGQPANVTVSFSSGTTSRTVTLNIISDGVSDSGEQFRAIVQRNSSDSVSTYLDRSSYVTINDPAASTTFSLTPSSTTITEGNTSITFTITRTGNITSSATIYASTLFDTASSPGDYDGLVNFVVPFAANDPTETFTVSINDDSLVESTEHFRVMIGDDTSDESAQALDISDIYITDDDTPAANNPPVVTGPSTINLVTGQVVAASSLYSSATDPDGSVAKIRFWDSTAETGYFAYDGQKVTAGFIDVTLAQLSRLTYVTGSNAGKNDIVIEAFDNQDLDGNDHAVRINIGGTTQNTNYTLVPSTTSAAEGGQVVFTITRTGDKPDETVFFSAWQDSASFEEGDYSLVGGGKPLDFAVHFNAEDPSKSVTLLILQDNQSDAGERFRAIVQSNPPSSNPAVNRAQTDFITINEGSQTSQYTLTPSTTWATEGAQVVFTITRPSGMPPGTVYFSTLLDGSATYGEGDYTFSSGGKPANIAVSFGAGETIKTVTLNIPDDGQSDSGEHFRAIVQANANDLTSTYLARSAYVTIADPPQKENPEEPGITIDFEIFSAKIAHAGELVVGDRLYLPFAAGVSATVKQAPGGGTSHNRGTATTAIDFGVPFGTEVRAMAGGYVVAVHGEHPNAVINGMLASATVDGNLTLLIPGYDLGPGFLGNFITIRHQVEINGVVRDVFATYAHLDPNLSDYIKTSMIGQYIPPGTTLGFIGHTGAITGPHLHVQVGWSKGTTQSGGGVVADGSDSVGLMEALKFAETGMAWPQQASSDPLISQNDPSKFSSSQVYNGSDSESLWQEFIAFVGESSDSVINISSSGAQAVVTSTGVFSQWVLDRFEDVRVAGNEFIDKLNILPLFGTTIRKNTIYFDGGAGDDEVNGSAADRRIVAEGGIGNDSFFGGSENDVLNGGEGDDLLNGGIGADLLIGDVGNDKFFIDDAADQVIEGANEGTSDRVFASVSYGLASAVYVETLSTDSDSGTAPISLAGNELDNIIRGNAGDNGLYGMGGVDELVGLGGNDNYLVDNALDRVIETAGGGYDTVLSSVSYTLAIDSAVEVLAADDVESATPMNLAGNAYGQRIEGNAGANVLFGGGGSDFLVGGAGNDTLIGGAGTDRLYGGADADIFVFTALSDSVEHARRSDGMKFAPDTVVDFTSGEDRIDLSFIDAKAGTPENDAFTFIGTAAFSNQAGQLRYDTVNGQIHLSLDVDGNGLADMHIMLGSALIQPTDFIL